MPAVKVESLSKEYVIGGGLPSLFRMLRRGAVTVTRGERFFALKDVDFEIEAGEAVGIIGKNGAGKSTLLKILSRITEPTSGRATLSGRVSSLLEVGTGFHPDLTGRENIFLNGVILGMRRAEIRRKFDEIVAFSGVEKFIDTPVKRFSSGMYVRLAFAVAAHLDPEILIVDEVLAVGDAEFQKRCMGKMGDVTKEGRTILFVSHSMPAVRSICRRAIWLSDGRIRLAGAAGEVTDEYLHRMLRADSLSDAASVIDALPADPVFRLGAVEVRQNGRPCAVVLNGQPAEVEIRYRVFLKTAGLRVYFDLRDDEGNILIRSFHDDDADEATVAEPGDYRSTATIPADLLAPKVYELRVFGTIHNVRDIPPGGIGIPFHVETNNGINRAYPREPVRSKLQPRIAWRTDALPADPRR